MKFLLIGERYKDKLEIPLGKLGFEPFWLPNNPNLDIRLASHADLSVFKHEKTIVIANNMGNSRLVKVLTNRGYKIILSEKEQSKDYPHDINLCAAYAGEWLIHNIAFTDRAIIDNVPLKHLNVKQGYARCTVLPVNNGLITADKGIVVKALVAGIEVLQICSGGVSLDGFNEGFIGGASFIAGDTIFFTGNIYSHPDHERIIEFIKKQGMEHCSLTDEPLFDIGGAIYIE